jgi:hypothetical protein
MRVVMETSGPELPAVRVFTRPGCHLCEILLEELMPLIRGRARLEVCDIQTRESWLAEYGTRIPVVEIGGQAVCQYHLDRSAVLAAINADCVVISTS